MNILIIIDLEDSYDVRLIECRNQPHDITPIIVFKRFDHYDACIIREAAPRFDSCLDIKYIPDTYVNEDVIIENEVHSLSDERASHDSLVLHENFLVSEKDNDFNNRSDMFRVLKDFRCSHPKNIIIGHLNINSIRHKFPDVYEMLSINCFDVFALSETKIDESFPSSQFSIPGFKLYRQDRN